MRGLDSACGKAPGDRHEGHLLLFFKRKSRLKKGRKREPNARKTTRHLGRTTAGGGRKARANARSLHRLSQFFARERFACAGTVHAAQPAAHSTPTTDGLRIQNSLCLTDNRWLGRLAFKDRS